MAEGDWACARSCGAAGRALGQSPDVGSGVAYTQCFAFRPTIRPAGEQRPSASRQGRFLLAIHPLIKPRMLMPPVMVQGVRCWDAVPAASWSDVQEQLPAQRPGSQVPAPQ